MYGFARIVENDDIRHHDASQVYDRLKQMDDSRHHNAEQIFVEGHPLRYIINI